MDTERDPNKDHIDDTATGDRTVLGVDLGVADPAVTSTGLFISGGELQTLC